MESRRSFSPPPSPPFPPQLMGRHPLPPRMTRNLPPRLLRSEPQKPVVRCRWDPPPAGEVAINCDASVRTDRIGLGCIGRSHTGAVLFAVATAARRNRDQLNSVVYHELEAILRGLEEALQRGFSVVRVFSDSLISVKILNGVRKAESSCHHLFHQIVAAASSLQSVSFSFTYREANKPADFLSKLCEPDDEEWVFDDESSDGFPEELRYLLCIDSLGMFHLRKPKCRR